MKVLLNNMMNILIDNKRENMMNLPKIEFKEISLQDNIDIIKLDGKEISVKKHIYLIWINQIIPICLIIIFMVKHLKLLN